MYKERIKSYIENELIYIEQYDSENGENDLKKLYNIIESEEKLKEIAEKMENDTELNEKINESIHFYLYH